MSNKSSWTERSSRWDHVQDIMLGKVVDVVSFRFRSRTNTNIDLRSWCASSSFPKRSRPFLLLRDVQQILQKRTLFRFWDPFLSRMHLVISKRFLRSERCKTHATYEHRLDEESERRARFQGWDGIERIVQEDGDSFLRSDSNPLLFEASFVWTTVGPWMATGS